MGAGFGVLEDGLADGQAGKGLAQVHLAALVGQLQRAHGLHGRIADQGSVKSIRSW
jgi:hypothetical protein